MKWTTPADLKAQVQRLWDRGAILASLAGGEPVFPRRLTLRGPGSRELSEQFSEVRVWIAGLSAKSSYRIEWRRINHRILGPNDIPAAIWVDSLDQALGLISRQQAAKHFEIMVETTRERRPGLVPWLAKRPLRALELKEDWPKLLDIVAWMNDHLHPLVYLRQVDLPGVHSKFIEEHRGVLAELFDHVLPQAVINTEASGLGGFCRRYGFKDKPLRVRFRILDPRASWVPGLPDQDITLTRKDFSGLDIPVSTVFITENEINFLAFPRVPGAMVIFGAGYGFENLAPASWLHEKAIRYWGDIDTHGFSILNQLRGCFPHANSFLMDRRTLLSHRALWGVEAVPETCDLDRLTPEESNLYDRLRQNHWGDRVRLEQERIGFDLLVHVLEHL
ncbi:MAG: Wadjet anti-phage system protein JetD domain-containing protein [Pseudomonadota bacterium]